VMKKPFTALLFLCVMSKINTMEHEQASYLACKSEIKVGPLARQKYLLEPLEFNSLRKCWEELCAISRELHDELAWLYSTKTNSYGAMQVDVPVVQLNLKLHIEPAEKRESKEISYHNWYEAELVVTTEYDIQDEVLKKFVEACKKEIALKTDKCAAACKKHTDVLSFQPISPLCEIDITICIHKLIMDYIPQELKNKMLKLERSTFNNKCKLSAAG
jgi:hypothetical protein